MGDAADLDDVPEARLRLKKIEGDLTVGDIVDDKADNVRRREFVLVDGTQDVRLEAFGVHRTISFKLDRAQDVDLLRRGRYDAQKPEMNDRIVVVQLSRRGRSLTRRSSQKRVNLLGVHAPCSPWCGGRSRDASRGLT